MANKYASVIQSGTNNYLTPAEHLNGVATDFAVAGVIGTITSTSGVAPTTGSFAVNAQGSPNMTVAVSAGQAYVSATPTGGSAQKIRVTSDASENVTIAANSTGGTRYDFVYIKVDPDKLNNPAVTGLDVVTLITQRSTTEGTDSNGAPSNSLLLAVVTVANGAASIANSVISDRRIRSDRTDDGWHYANETWTYLSATTITVPTDATTRYAVGDKISFYQSGSLKYFYITGVAATVLTVTAGTTYTVANAVITQPRHSTDATPLGFPTSFAFTPSWTNLTVGTGGNANNTGYFSMAGKIVLYRIAMIFGSSAPSMGTAPRFVAPVAPSTDYYKSSIGLTSVVGNVIMLDTGTAEYHGVARISSVAPTTSFEVNVDNASATYIQNGQLTSVVPHAWAAGDGIFVTGSYEVA
jgi:hypothetical protein